MTHDYQRAQEILEDKFASYLRAHGLSDLEKNTTVGQLEPVFLKFVEDYLEYRLTFDDFSTLCEQLLMVLRNKGNAFESELFSVSHYGAELSWYVRNDPLRAGEFLEIIIDYYTSHAGTKVNQSLDTFCLGS